ncbi:MAG: glutaminyl-peptide cyclotransferase [Pseudomonadota bacterium]
MKSILPSFLFLLLILSHALTQALEKHTPPPLNPDVIAEAAYDSSWFTQGLYKEDNTFYVSSGLYKRSFLVKQNAHKRKRYTLAANIFAEGLTILDNTLYLLSWKENTLFLFDKNTLKPKGKLPYKGEGWGLTDNGAELIMSNGSNQLLFRDKNDFRINKVVEIQGLDLINELEYVDEVIWANRWYDDVIYAIDYQQACILAKIDLSSLRKQAKASNQDQVTNGIAYDKEHNGLWVSGKFWSKRFLIKLPKIEKRCLALP